MLRRTCLALAALVFTAAAQAVPAVGQPAPEFALQEAVDQGVVWLAINSTAKASGEHLEPARLVAWNNERKARPTAVLMDQEGTAGRAYGARTTPHMYIVDPQGRLIYAGGIDSIPSSNPDDIQKAVNYVRQGLNEALAGKPISAASTRAYGCSIKYKS